tara:strand:+ start:2331 stop:3743 length:1413 start_codon:yes stop_codon:yes gene_type:complete
MGTTTDHLLGRNLRYFVKKETVTGGKYGASDQEALAGTNAAKVTASSIDFQVARNDRMDSRTTRSALEKITGKQEVTWSCDSFILPKGGTTVPDVDPLIEAAMGTGLGAGTPVQSTITGITLNNPLLVTCSGGHNLKTNDRIRITEVVGTTQVNNLTFTVTVTGSTTFTCNGIDGTSGHSSYGSAGKTTLLTYRPSDVNALPTLRIARTGNDVLREDLFGAYVEEMTVSASGGDVPKMTFSGGAFNYALTGTGTTEGAGSSATALITESGNGVSFMVGSVISFNSLNDKVVQSKSSDTLTIASSSWSDGQAVTPTTYTESTGGNPLNGMTGSLTLNSVEIPITSFEMTLANGLKAVSDEAFEKGTSDFIAGFRAVTGTIGFRARKDLIKNLTQRYVQATATADPSFTTIPIVVKLGTESGDIMVIHLPTVELNFAGIEIPESEEAILSVPFTALGSSGADELLISINQTS